MQLVHMERLTLSDQGSGQRPRVWGILRALAVASADSGWWLSGFIWQAKARADF